MRRIGGVLAVVAMAAAMTVAAPAPEAEAYETGWYLVWEDSQITGNGCGWLGCYINVREYRGYGKDRGGSVFDRRISVGIHGQAVYTWNWKQTRSRTDRRDCTVFTSGGSAGQRYCGSWVSGTAGSWVKVRNTVRVYGELDYVDGSGRLWLTVGSCSKSRNVTSGGQGLSCSSREIKPRKATELRIELSSSLTTDSGVYYDNYGGSRTISRPGP